MCEVLQVLDENSPPWDFQIVFPLKDDGFENVPAETNFPTAVLYITDQVGSATWETVLKGQKLVTLGTQ